LFDKGRRTTGTDTRDSTNKVEDYDRKLLDITKHIIVFKDKRTYEILIDVVVEILELQQHTAYKKNNYYSELLLFYLKLLTVIDKEFIHL